MKVLLSVLLTNLMLCSVHPIPVLIKVRDTSTSDHRSGRAQADLTPFFIGDAECAEVVLNTGLLDARIRFPLGLWYSPRAVRDKYPENRAMAHLVRIDYPKTPWYGPAVVVKYCGSRCSGFADVTETDLTSVAAYFMGFQQ